MRVSTIVMGIVASLFLVACGQRSDDPAITSDGAIPDPDGSLPGCTATKPIPGPSPHQKVTFTFSSTNSAKSWVVTEGESCAALSLVVASKSLALFRPYPTICEGPAPAGPAPRAAALLANNPSLIWSGFELKGHEACYDCDDRGWPGVGIVSVTEYVRVAAPAGSYKATFQVLDAPPSNCNEMSDGDFELHHDQGLRLDARRPRGLQRRPHRQRDLHPARLGGSDRAGGDPAARALSLDRGVQHAVHVCLHDLGFRRSPPLSAS